MGKKGKFQGQTYEQLKQQDARNARTNTEDLECEMVARKYRAMEKEGKELDAWAEANGARVRAEIKKADIEEVNAKGLVFIEEEISKSVGLAGHKIAWYGKKDENGQMKRVEALRDVDKLPSWYLRKWDKENQQEQIGQ